MSLNHTPHGKIVKNRRKRRTLIMALALTAVLFALMCRLFWVQVLAVRGFSGHRIDLAKVAVQQRQRSLLLDSGRGQFLDRRMQPLTGRRKLALAMFPLTDTGLFAGEIGRVAAVLGMSGKALERVLYDLKQPALWNGKDAADKRDQAGEITNAQAQTDEVREITSAQAETIEALHVPFVMPVTVTDRYDYGMPASHLIGFIGQNPERVSTLYAEQLKRGELTLSSQIGGAGLEKTFQPWLGGIGGTSITYYIDPDGRMIGGLGMRMIGGANRHYPMQAVTTVDLEVQRIVERALKATGIKQGAVVVLDAATGDIAAMASAPQFDPGQIHPEAGNWGNRALKAAAPGSIFKTVIAAAALEEGAVSKREKFECDGSLGKYGFHCWKPEGHGRLTLAEAFAESCNVAFARVAQRLSAEQIERYARKLGLMQTVGWTGTAGKENPLFHQLDNEDAGQLFAAGTSKTDEGVRVQTAIGQRDVRVTPLQAANLVVTLLHGGEVRMPRAVKDIRFHDGLVLKKFNVSTLLHKGDGISTRTARKLIAWMEDTVTDGTAQALRTAKWKLAGKTGTAETLQNGKPRVNQWFIGYGPVQSPRYAIAVLAENELPDAQNRVLPYMRKVMDALSALPLQ